ncbi:MAG: VCBS repeat-containing protein [Spirosomaceae bacterium]|nr:VCBS repeat-containing protein [Spirosomataceae bacterium]
MPPKKPIFYILHFTLFIFSLASCRQEKPLFELLPPEQTGLFFQNTITERDTVNILDAEFVYNGAGVAVGDLNGDGLQDIYLAANQVENRLFINRTGTPLSNSGEEIGDGEVKFEDVTDIAGAKKRNLGEWSSGVTMIDLNQDGKLDIYVCNTFSPTENLRRNLLFINQGNDAKGIPHFKQMAEEYGLDNGSHSSHAAFLDYDRDGDLDVFIGVNFIEDRYPNIYKTLLTDGTAPNRDILLRNDWNDTLQHPTFTDVSLAAGIVHDGYSHSSTVMDFNDDGWPDVYVANDYKSNDIVYINNQNGTFTNRVGEVLKHLSLSAMGSDAADINNDGRIDLITCEMLPTYNKRKKQLMMANNYQDYLFNEQYGYQYQYVRNTLQLNRGQNPETGLSVFSDIAFLGEVQETDWSWSPMLADFDNDGLRDLIVTNGYVKDVSDQDFSSFRKNIETSLLSKDQIYHRIPAAKFASVGFKNKNGLQFEDVSKTWGITQPAFSNGSAYADFDNDGDLDWVVNNIDDNVFFYKNTLNDNPTKEKPAPNFLKIKLKGPRQNTLGIGSRVSVYAGGQRYVSEQLSARGYLSKSDDVLHFGLGNNRKIDSVQVRWPDGKIQLLKAQKVNQTMVVDYNAGANLTVASSPQTTPLLVNISAKSLGIDYKNLENDYIDFNVQKTLPHKFSQYGPGAAVGDLNGDGLDDFVLSGSGRMEGYLFTQKPNGAFAKTQLNFKVGEQKKEEDLGLLLFDADNDGDNDLYVTFGSYQHPLDSPLYQDVLLLNDGKGRFQKDSLALPPMRSSKQTVRAIDYDHDGDLDLFVGSRVKAERYPEADRSYILRNGTSPLRPSASSPLQMERGQGVRFTDVTAQVCPALANIGLVSDALWTDFDNDGWQDLLIAGEWMPLTFLKNNKGKSFDILSRTGGPSDLDTHLGWWNSLCGADFDNDGDTDYIAGNFGQNTFFRCTSNEPLTIYGKDFDENGRYDSFISCYFKDSLGTKREYFYHSRDDMVKQLITIRRKFERYGDFGEATVDKVFGQDELKGATILKANWMSSSYVENLGNGQFKLTALPIEAQVAPVYGIVPYDVDNDGLLDVLLIGNDYGMEVFQGRADGFYGLVLKNTGKGFRSIELNQSGFFVPHDARALTRLRVGTRDVVMATQNRRDLRFFTLSKSPTDFVKVMPNETYGVWTLANGRRRKVEFYYGSTFLSQESRQVAVPSGAKSLVVFSAQGKSRTLEFETQKSGK